MRECRKAGHYLAIILPYPFLLGRLLLSHIKTCKVLRILIMWNNYTLKSETPLWNTTVGSQMDYLGQSYFKSYLKQKVPMLLHFVPPMRTLKWKSVYIFISYDNHFPLSITCLLLLCLAYFHGICLGYIAMMYSGLFISVMS